MIRMKKKEKKKLNYNIDFISKIHRENKQQKRNLSVTGAWLVTMLCSKPEALNSMTRIRDQTCGTQVPIVAAL